jgi:hypothetical protein
MSEKLKRELMTFVFVGMMIAFTFAVANAMLTDVLLPAFNWITGSNVVSSFHVIL